MLSKPSSNLVGMNNALVRQRQRRSAALEAERHQVRLLCLVVHAASVAFVLDDQPALMDCQIVGHRVPTFTYVGTWAVGSRLRLRDVIL